MRSKELHMNLYDLYDPEEYFAHTVGRHTNFTGWTVHMDMSDFVDEGDPEILSMQVLDITTDDPVQKHLCDFCSSQAVYVIGQEHNDVIYCQEHLHESVTRYDNPDTWIPPVVVAPRHAMA